MAENWQKCSK